MKFFWLDLETTGLDPMQHILLEVAIAEADLLSPFEFGPIIARVRNFQRSWIDDRFIYDMHTKNGLWDDCEKSKRGSSDIEDELLELVPEIQDREEMPVLAGSSVHFDHAFLRAQMPLLAKRFSHRYYDVSALKLECRSLGMEKVPKGEAHRAAADIRESVEHAKLCRSWMQALNRNRS